MNKLKEEQGITLVALIITIVVLLILAIVAIGAVRDSKIIAHAQDATSDYTIAQEKEQIGLAVSEWNIEKVIPGNNPVFKNVIESALQGQIEPIVENADGSLTITFNKTGNSYTVTKEGEISEAQPGNSGGEGEGSGETDATISLLEQYLFGDSPNGKDYLTELSSNGTNYNKNDELGITAEDITGIGMLQTSTTEYTFYIEYDEAKYKFKTEFTNMSTNTIPSYGVIRIDDWDAESKVGKYVKDESNNIWRIIYADETHGLQMISANTFQYKNADFSLGYNDTLITDWTKINTETEEFKLADLNKNKTLDDDLEKSIYSYNQAVETLNTACENLFKDENGNYTRTYIQDVRCVGSNPIFTNKNDENTTPCTSADVSVLATWPKNNENQAVGLCDGKGYSTDNNFETDFDRMFALGIKASNANYWLASRGVRVISDAVYFNIRCVDSVGDYDYDVNLWSVYESGAVGNYNDNALRPVVSLSSDIQFSGEGTEANPYTF